MEEITIIHCFDNRYCAPAAVAFMSMLEHADKARRYALKVLSNDISSENQAKLQDVVRSFPNATLEFLSPENDFERLYEGVSAKAHYSKEILYKLTIPLLFPNVKLAIITDVDCIYQDDICVPYDEFAADDENYMAGVGYGRLPISAFSDYSSQYAREFSEEECRIIHAGVGAGFMIYNLEKMRQDGVVERLLECFKRNCGRVRQPEQDVLNMVCYTKIRRFNERVMVCSYLYDCLTSEERILWNEILKSPIQLHYATDVKPWNEPSCTKANLWWEYLVRTPFYYVVANRFSCALKKSIWQIFGTIPLLEVWRQDRGVVRVRFLHCLELSPLGTNNCLYNGFQALKKKLFRKGVKCC